MKTVKITIRTDRETGRPVLFFWNSNAQGHCWLECYDRIGQHSQATVEYMRACAPIHPGHETPQALALIREWRHLGPETVAVQTMQRLARGA